jgi:SAM-dependent methyltransferase
MKGIAACPDKSAEQMTREWDRMAEERHRQLLSDEDVSFHHVVAPTALRLLEGADTAVTLDIGSGTGHFTVSLARIAKRVIGIEPSVRSVAVAKDLCREARNVQFVEGYLENSLAQIAEMEPTSAAAVMTLMSVVNLSRFADGLASVLPVGARFVAIITHPWFWPKYWGYEAASWFCYGRETFIEAPFTISRRRSKIITTHIHRPLEQYMAIFSDAGFRLERISEPIPEPAVEALYPKRWTFPRFLGLQWKRTGAIFSK